MKSPTLLSLFFGAALFVSTLYFAYFPDQKEYKEYFDVGSQVLGEITSSIEEQQVPAGRYLVEDVVDGDTIKVWIEDKIQTVRIANINTPETVDPRKSVECMGKEASDKMHELLIGKSVSLKEDDTQAKTDRYGRLLRFVFLEDGTDVGLQMISLGLAHSAPYGTSPHVFYDAYESAQNKAKEQQIGLWNPNSCG